MRIKFATLVMVWPISLLTIALRRDALIFSIFILICHKSIELKFLIGSDICSAGPYSSRQTNLGNPVIIKVTAWLIHQKTLFSFAYFSLFFSFLFFSFFFLFFFFFLSIIFHSVILFTLNLFSFFLFSLLSFVSFYLFPLLFIPKTLPLSFYSFSYHSFSLSLSLTHTHTHTYIYTYNS